MFDIIKEIYNFIKDNYSTGNFYFFVFMICLVIIYQFIIYRSYKARIKDKDIEIQRLIEERNRLQDYCFTKIGEERLTSRRKDSKFCRKVNLAKINSLITNIF